MPAFDAPESPTDVIRSASACCDQLSAIVADMDPERAQSASALWELRERLVILRGRIAMLADGEQERLMRASLGRRRRTPAA